MRLVEFFTKQIEKWNLENKCGQCFEFHAPLTESALNKQQLQNSCCVSVMLTRDRVNAFGTDFTVDRRFGFNSDEWKYKNFTLLFVLPQGLDLNNHTEILGNEIDNAKYVVLEDLEECIDEMELDFCDLIKESWMLSNWTATQLINYAANNYTGWRVNVTIRQRKNKYKKN